MIEDLGVLIRRIKATHEPVPVEDEVDAFFVLEPSREVALADLPTSPKKYLKWVSQNPGWQTHAQRSITRHEPVIYAADSKKKPGQEQPENRKGDVRVTARDVEHWGLQAAIVRDRVGYAWFWASWETINGKTTFTGANRWDGFTEEKLLERQAGGFDEWLRILAPTGAPKKKEPKPEIDPIEPLMAELEKGEWNG